MKKGDIYIADLNPVQGSEQAGVRPVLVISGNSLNDNLPIAIVCPLTTKIKNMPGCVVLQPSKENGLVEVSEVITFQVRSVSQKRLQKKLGSLSGQQLSDVYNGLAKIFRY